MNPDCGTMRGYRKHLHLKQPTCPPCKEAKRQDNIQRDARGPSPEKPMTPQETAAEIEHLLRLNQGSYTILKKLGNPSTDTLRRKLHRAKRADLIPRLLNMEDQAA